MLATGTMPGSARVPWLEYFTDKVVRTRQHGGAFEARFHSGRVKERKRDEKERERTERVEEKTDGRWDPKGKKIDR